MTSGTISFAFSTTFSRNGSDFFVSFTCFSTTGSTTSSTTDSTTGSSTTDSTTDSSTGTGCLLRNCLILSVNASLRSVANDGSTASSL